MQITRDFDEHYFLQCLNESFSIRPGRRVPAPPVQYAQASDVFSQKLIPLIDEWLDSARSSDGVEQPRSRKPGSAGVEALVYFRNANPPSQYLREDGETEVIFPVERRSIGPDGKEDPIGDSEFEALRLFSAFMDRPHVKARLAKCRRCGVYYLSQRRLASVYKNGTHCVRCRNKESAARSQADSRKTRQEQLLDLAAEAWKKWESRPIRIHRSVWIAEEVNKRLGSWTKRIRRNWVTANERDIVRRTKDLKE